MKHHGSSRIESRVTTKTGRSVRLSQGYAVSNVTRPILSVSAANDSGNTCWFASEKSGGSGMAKAANLKIVVKGDYLPFTREKGIFSTLSR